MKKLLALIGLIALICIGWTSPSEAAESTPEPCVGSITGPGTATSNGNCILVVYRYADDAPGPDQLNTSLPQTLTDVDDSGSENLSVTLPDCFWQVDLVDSDAIIANPLTAVDYYSSHGWLVDAEHGGTSECFTPPPTTVPETTTTVPETTTTVPPTTVPPCNDEAAPCWDCETMGNLICGTTTTEPPVVTTAPSTPPPANELPRTGNSNSNLLLIVFGCAIAGGAFIYLSKSLNKQFS